MKHRVTNFGSKPIVIFLVDGTCIGHLGAGESFTGEVERIDHQGGRVHYSVRPAERAAAPDPFPADEDEE